MAKINESTCNQKAYINVSRFWSKNGISSIENFHASASEGWHMIPLFVSLVACHVIFGKYLIMACTTLICFETYNLCNLQVMGKYLTMACTTIMFGVINSPSFRFVPWQLTKLSKFLVFFIFRKQHASISITINFYHK